MPYVKITTVQIWQYKSVDKSQLLANLVWGGVRVRGVGWHMLVFSTTPVLCILFTCALKSRYPGPGNSVVNRAATIPSPPDKNRSSSQKTLVLSVTMIATGSKQIDSPDLVMVVSLTIF